MMFKLAAVALLVAFACAAPSNNTIKLHILSTDPMADWQPPNVFTTLKIGSNGVSYKLLMDQYFDDLLIRGPRCTSLSCKGDGKTERKTYDPKTSSTSKDQGDTFKVRYGTTVTGGYWTDTVSVDGISDTDVGLGVLSTASQKFYTVEADGVFGLSFLGNTRGKKNLASPVDSILKSAKNKLVSVWFNKATSNDNRYGVLTFGKLNTDNCSSQIQYSLVDDDFAFKVQKIRYMTLNAHRELKATISPESYSIGLPTTIYKDFLRTATGSDTTEQTACSKLKGLTLDIKIGGVFYSLKSEDFTYPSATSSSYCKFLVTDNGDEFDTGYVLGEPFFRRFCTTYDISNKQIGFSPTK